MLGGTNGRSHRRATSEAFARLNLLGESPAFREALRLIERIAAVDATVLIHGETGTGKDLAAHAVHYLSRRCDFAFVPVNCGALPDNLLESELFGHERGAFTDAKRANRGLIAQAEGGTLFLDEVEAMTPRAQVVLLRFLQDHQYRPVGSSTVRSGDVRIIAASNVDLGDLVRRHLFRADLLFRFGVLSLTMPPLRCREDDAVLLARYFLDRYSAQYQRPPKPLHPDAIIRLRAGPWPGNVREIENLVLREFLLADGPFIDLRSAGLTTESSNADAPASGGTDLDMAFKPAKAQVVAKFERTYLSHLLTKTSGNISLAARLSKKDRSALNKLVKKHGLAGEQFRNGTA